MENSIYDGCGAIDLGKKFPFNKNHAEAYSEIARQEIILRNIIVESEKEVLRMQECGISTLKN